MIQFIVPVLVIAFIALVIILYKYVYRPARAERKEAKESEKLAHPRGCKCIACKLLPK